VNFILVNKLLYQQHQLILIFKLLLQMYNLITGLLIKISLIILEMDQAYRKIIAQKLHLI